jgi:hypothetical protein
VVCGGVGVVLTPVVAERQTGLTHQEGTSYSSGSGLETMGREQNCGTGP